MALQGGPGDPAITLRPPLSRFQLATSPPSSEYKTR